MIITCTIYSYKTAWRVPKLIIIATKKYLLLEINTITKFLLFKIKYVHDGCYLVIDTCYCFIIPIRDWTYAWMNLQKFFFYKQRFLSIQPHWCLTLPYIEIYMLLGCCLIHIGIIILKNCYCSVHLCSWLDLGLFVPYLCDLFFISIFICIMINLVISWINIH